MGRSGSRRPRRRCWAAPTRTGRGPVHRRGATPLLFEPAPAGRTHVVESLPGETVEAGRFDPTRGPLLTIDSGDTLVYPNTLTHFLGRVRPGVSIGEIAEMRRDHPGRGPHSIIGPVAVRGPSRVMRWNFASCGSIRLTTVSISTIRSTWGTGALPQDFPDGQVRYFDLDRATMSTTWGPRVRIPLGPFQGTIGVSPAVDEAVSSVPPGPYGGNIDLRELIEGRGCSCRWKPGALIFTGDSHVAQGDGEVNLTAIESAMRDVRMQVILHKATPPPAVCRDADALDPPGYARGPERGVQDVFAQHDGISDARRGVGAARRLWAGQRGGELPGSRRWWT